MINQDLPLLSVVVETFNAQPGSAIEIELVLKKIAQQTYPAEKIELIIVIDSKLTQLISFFETNYPKCRLVLIEESHYYHMKYYGLKAAKGDIIAILDSDCIPSLGWAQSIVDKINGGADFVAGKTRYSKEAMFSRLFSFFSFGHVFIDSKGKTNTFIPNNAAFKKIIVDNIKYDNRRKRCFGAHLLTQELKKQNYKLEYNPSQVVAHYNYGIRYHITNRFRSGYEAVMLCQNDTSKVLGESKYLKLGILLPFAISIRRFIHDLKTLYSNRKDLNIALFEIPLFFTSCLLIRGYEIIPGLITIVSPTYLKKKYDW